MEDKPKKEILKTFGVKVTKFMPYRGLFAGIQLEEFTKDELIDLLNWVEEGNMFNQAISDQQAKAEAYLKKLEEGKAG